MQVTGGAGGSSDPNLPLDPHCLYSTLSYVYARPATVRGHRCQWHRVNSNTTAIELASDRQAVYTIQTVVKPVVQPVYNRFDNRLYRVNGVSVTAGIRKSCRLMMI